jgi:hypothetical protein
VTEFVVQRWSAWAPGLDSREAWRRWSEAPCVPALDGAPEVRVIPAMQRRRLSRVAKMTVQVAYDVVGDLGGAEALRAMPMVFASRHCEVRGSAEILRDMAADLPLSPTAFSHSVHNAPVGQLSIIAGNRRPAVSVSAQRATFAAGLIEALALCRRSGGEPVLFLAADEPVPAEFERFGDEPSFTCATAMIVQLARDAAPDSQRMRLLPGARRDPTRRADLPDTLLCIAWLLRGAGATEFHGSVDATWRVEHVR